jgi:hypothetical protein
MSPLQKGNGPKKALKARQLYLLAAAPPMQSIKSRLQNKLATNSVQITATRAPLLALLLDREPPPAFAALSDGITTVLPLALPLTPYVFHGAFHGRPTVMR